MEERYKYNKILRERYTLYKDTERERYEREIQRKMSYKSQRKRYDKKSQTVF